MEDIQAIKQKLALANRILVNEGGGRILVPAHLHAYGRTIADCRENDLLVIDLDGKVAEF
jgi:hypothetical protein